MSEVNKYAIFSTILVIYLNKSLKWPLYSNWRKFSNLNKFFLLPLIIYIGNIFVNLEKILKFDFRPYSAFKFGGRNRKPNSENFRFRPKISASGRPLCNKHFTIKLEVFEFCKEKKFFWCT